MNTHPIFTEQDDDEEWLDWWNRQLDAVTSNPPPAPPGFILLPCEATPRHWPTYTLDDGETDGLACCHHCSADAYAAEHRTCRHDINHRGAWRRWKAIHKIAGWLYTLGVVRSYGTSFGGGCSNCLSGIRWTLFGGPYVLFVPRETWRCWRAGHRRGPDIGLGFCGKCIPQPCCGSTGIGHTDDCPSPDIF
jgi:hypothetical protein